MKKYSKVELATIKNIKAKYDENVAAEASEKIGEIEEKVSKLTEKQIAHIQERYDLDVINVLGSLKISIKAGCNGKTALLYNSLKSVLNNRNLKKL